MKRKSSIFLCFTVVFSLLVTTTTLANDYLREPVPKERMNDFPNNVTYPWKITKSDGQKFTCTGTVLPGNKFLSAGHCVTDSKGNYGQWTSAETDYGTRFHDLSFKMYKKNVFVKSPFKVMPGYAGYKDFKNDISVTNITEPNNIKIDTGNVKLKVYKNLNSLVGKKVTTVGYSTYLYGIYTKTEGKVLAVENDGTLTVDFYVANENSGSAVYLDGEIIGVLTGVADIPECRDGGVCSKGTVTPFTLDIKKKLLDPMGVPNTVA